MRIPGRVSPARYGTIDGPTRPEVVRRRFHGLQVLAGSWLLAIAASAVDAAIGMASALVTSFAVLMALFLIYRLVLGARPGRGPGGAARLAGALVRSVWRLALRVARWAGGSLRTRGTGRIGVVEQQLTVYRFRVRERAGRSSDHVMYGELTNVPPRPGELVRLSGRRCVVRTVEVLAGPDGPVSRRVTARIPIPYRCVRWGDRACYLLAPATLVWAALSIAGVVG
ncbi:hypothetical protein J2S43_001655 [Catenuloplanes nepalensis]|uniref:DUF4131 domain-containing protein n=1 Tax=Catenuloplanes nepalensis TaxID=587533 RepID=A0ABT9MPD0_9ACTN|nr:hypothetical protein [Catenuloplanes nepalensis]MDP9793143.1 hypothetical protein [Catenuloplanes nepalensis]